MRGTLRTSTVDSRPAHLALIFVMAVFAVIHAQEGRKPLGYSDTPMLPGGKWHVHDGKRPQPTVVTPSTFSSQQSPGTPPSDAVVLFNGSDVSRWQDAKGGPARWTIDAGALVVAAGTGNIMTKEAFGDCQLHVEWSAPSPPKGEDQDRGNSGVFLMGRYEIQVLDSFHAQTYPDGQAAAIYGQFPPLVNAARKPGDWQTYDIVFTAPRFNGQAVAAPATVTVFHNGVVVHNHATLIGSTVHRALGKYEVHPAKAPLMLQDHEHPVRYRNIWIRALKGYDEP
jgi:hypothetical protein